MALFWQHNGEAFRLAVWQADETEEELLAHFSPSLRTEYECEARRFTMLHRRMEWLAVRALLAKMVGEERRICYEPSGKPFLDDRSQAISISHTKGYVALALYNGAAVGIDIEQYGQRVHRVASRFLHPDEQVAPYRDDRTWGLLLHWSAKESVYKCMEHPDADLRRLCAQPFVPCAAGSFRIQSAATEPIQWFDVNYRIAEDFVLTWTTR